MRSRWFDTHRQAARATLREGDACTVGMVFLLLTGALILAIIVSVQIGVL
jgi:hypothetical protein